MAWWHHDSNVADPFPKPSEFDASDVAKLCKVVIILRKPPPSLLYAACLSYAWKHAGLLMMVEFRCLPNFHGCKVAAGSLLLPKKKNKVEAKAAANAFNADIQVKKVASKRCVGKEGASRKRRKVRLETTLHPNSEHVSSPVPLNYPKPLEALANEEHVSRNTSAGEEKGQDNVDTAFVNEGHGNNEGGLSGLRTQPSPFHHLDQRLDSVKKPARDTMVPDAEASYFTGCFGNLPFTPQWGLIHSCRMDNSHSCQDMISNLFTPNDNEFLIREYVMSLPSSGLGSYFVNLRSSRQTLYFEGVEELEKEKGETEEVCAKQAERIKQLEAELKQSEIDTHQLCVDREKYVDECGNGEIVRRMIINELLLCAGCIRALSTNGRWERPSALLLAKRYPYVDKVARAYLLDLAGLHNVMPDETSPMSGGD
ncbi:hypothetical protein Tco_1151148 [Tanacetum coccineum]